MKRNRMNMQCEQLDDYLDDGLDEVSKERFEQHLKVCEECRSWVASESSLGEVLRWTEAEVRPSTATIMTKESAGLVWNQQRTRQLGFWGGIALASCILLFIWTQSRDPSRDGSDFQTANSPETTGADSRNENRVAEEDTSPGPGALTRVENDANSDAEANQRLADFQTQPASIRLRDEASAERVVVSPPVKSKNMTLVMFYPSSSKPRHATTETTEDNEFIRPNPKSN